MTPDIYRRNTFSCSYWTVVVSSETPQIIQTISFISENGRFSKLKFSNATSQSTDH